MLIGYRSNDPVITICQNNRAKSIEITEINPAAETLLAYKNSELAGKPLGQFLPPRIGEMLKEYVEFESNANDVGEVLAKVQSFSFIGRDGKETGYRMKVVRAEAEDAAIFFRLVLQDKTGLRKNETLHKAIQDNFKGHETLDPDTGLPDRPSLAKDIELIGYYSNKSDLRAAFCILQLDHYDELFSQYGRETCRAILKHIGHICRQSLRPDDVVGSVSYKRLGVLLLDLTPDSTRMVCNRLRWQIAANPFTLPDKTSVGLSVSIAFCRIGGRISDKSALDKCDEALNGLGASVVNALDEVSDSNKKAG
ncbi:MAG: diguanylate cyclase [Pseudomonadota bacterium]|nr:diguanylate cyclase [Pseudomonadota bacterium]